jgi:asparagine synthase (glutamine-hydrolysing)
MCGIWAYVHCNKSNNGTINLPQCFTDFYKLKHRGPTNSYFETYENVCIGFHRLAIMDDTFHSNQPFILEDETRTIIFICNGEIYNFKTLIEYYNLDKEIKNDCFVIPTIYMQLCQRKQEHTFMQAIKNTVEGEFAFILFEFNHSKVLQKIIACRDEIGIRPLYYNPSTTYGSLLFTSEIKGANSYPGELKEFPPGHMLIYDMSEDDDIKLESIDYSSVYQTRPPLCLFDERLETLWGEYQPSDEDYLLDIRTSVINSVNRRLVADKPIAFLLSGGVDSSLVAAIASRSLGTSIRTFCCGMEEGTDLKFARDVAKKIGSYHTEVIFTPQQGLEVIPDVVRTIESWDTTTVRASVGQYLVSQYISNNTDCKVVLVGEGPDEVCSSYLFNWYAPNGEALDAAAKDYVKEIHYFDVKRADRCIARWGLEGRVPLLDPEFIHAYWWLPYEERMPTYYGMEKWWLRKAFENEDLLPEHVLMRKKEAFSDGVSGQTSWFQIIQEFVDDKVTDQEMAVAAKIYPYCTPTTKEAFYYRKLFCEYFGEDRQNIIPHYWQPKWDANGKEIRGYVDPSARTLSIYNDNIDVNDKSE